MAAAGNRRVLVVGGAGYIGNGLVRDLLGAGHEVRVLDALIYEHGAAIAGIFEAPGFSFLRGDVRSDADVEAAMEGVTDVVLLAALVGDPVSKKYPELTREVNVEGAKRVFAASRKAGVGRFVFTSTCSNYGLRETSEAATEESELALAVPPGRGALHDDSADLDRLRDLAADAFRPDDLGVHAHDDDRRRATGLRR
jgi:nucleoside-diphosphate-sugar epimerase